MNTVKDRIFIFITVVIILLILCKCKSLDDSFRTQEEKRSLASHLIKNGEPNFHDYKLLGLDGAEFYEGKQLWRKNKYNETFLSKIL